MPFTLYISGTAYGKGVYFAVNASYSATGYSIPDENGNMHMFVARVLTGEYTKGNPRYLIPPAKDSKKSDLHLYDSVVDNKISPSMFVIFYDPQSYPEYLITFK